MTIDQIIRRGGGVTELAKTMGVNHSTVCGWRRKGRVPVDRAVRISDVLAIPRHEIRPDIWPAEGAV